MPTPYSTGSLKQMLISSQSSTFQAIRAACHLAFGLQTLAAINDYIILAKPIPIPSSTCHTPRNFFIRYLPVPTVSNEKRAYLRESTP